MSDSVQSVAASRGNLWTRWVAWLSLQESGVSMAGVRIIIGLTVMHTLGTMWWSGVYQVAWYDVADGGFRSLGDGNFFLSVLGGPAPGTVAALMAVCMTSAALMVVGAGGAIAARAYAFTTLQSFMALADINSHAGGSYDELITNILWILVLMGPTRTWSLETFRSTGRWVADPAEVSRHVMLWPRMLIVFQAVVMYGTTGWQKLSAHWVPGGDFSALYYILQQPTWQLYDMRWVAWIFPLTQIGTAVSWFWEVTSPLWMVAWLASLPPGPAGRFGHGLVRWRVREIYLLLGLIFHIVIALTMNIGPFSWASLALYPAFIHPAEWRGWRAWAESRR